MDKKNNTKKKIILTILALILVVVGILFALKGCQKEEPHVHSYKINEEGTWVCKEDGDILSNTDKPYVAILENDQPKDIIAVDILSKTKINLGNGTINKDGNNIYYSGNNAQTVIIKTQKVDDKQKDKDALVINAPNGTVYHYGSSTVISLDAVATESFHEYGKVDLITLTKARVVLENKSDVKEIYLDINNSNYSYETSIIALKENVELPRLTRDAVDLEEGEVKTLAIVQKLKDEVKTETNTETNEVIETVLEVQAADDDYVKIENVRKSNDELIIEAFLSPNADENDKTLTDNQSTSTVTLEEAKEGSSHPASHNTFVPKEEKVIEVVKPTETPKEEPKQEETKPVVTPTEKEEEKLEEEKPAPKPHVHSYGSLVSLDDEYHGKKCSCGNVIEKEGHNFEHKPEGEKCIKYCTECNYSVEEEHDYFNENTNKFLSKCPNCNATLGTEEIPWHVTNGVEFHAMTNRSGYFKQTHDITITDTQYAIYMQGCTYDGDNHNLYLDESVTADKGYCMAFCDPLFGFKLSNLNFYSNDNALLSLIFTSANYGKYNNQIYVENCNAKSINGKIIETNGTNATVFLWNNAYMNYDYSTNIYTPGKTELSFKNCNNYVNFYNKNFSASVMMAIPGACDDWKKVEFINCNNYGVVQSDSAAGLISSHLYTDNYQRFWTVEQLVASMKVEDCNNYGIIKAQNYVGLFCDANGDNKDKNGKSFVDALNSAFNGFEPNYIKTTELEGDYTICFDNNKFSVITDNVNDINYQLRIGFGNITTPGVGFTNTAGMFFIVDTVESGTSISATQLHAYDAETAIVAGVIEQTEQLNYINNSGYHVALKQKDNTLYIIFSSDDKVLVDTNCSFGIYAYKNGVNIGYKELH